MADRTTKVTLAVVNSEYKKGMREAAQATRELGTEGEKLAQTREAMQLVGRTGIVMGAAIATGLGVAVAKFAEFDQQMSYVAATGQDAKDNLDELRDAALEAGASTVFSATEAGGAIENLSKAGIDASQILGGALKGSLDLAAAGGLGVAQAAEIAATTMQQFQLKGKDASHVADLLAAGAGKAMGDVTDMAQALNQGGLIAAQFGVSVEETVGTLSAFAQAGLLGSDAGTSFRTMLLRLANPTEEVKTLMKDLGIEAYDTQGNFIGLAGLAGELETGLAGMTQQQKDTTLAMIFGQDAIRGANILLREGEDGIKDWTAAVDDQGYAADVAATRLDNLKGDIEAFNGALDTALITIGSASDGPLRLFVQSITDMVDGFNGLPEGGQQAVFWVGAVAAGASLAAGTFLVAVPKVVEYKNSIEQLGTGAQRTSRILGALGRGVGTAAVIATVVTVASNALIAYGREVRGTDDAVAKATTTNQTFIDSMNQITRDSSTTAESVTRALDAIDSGNTLGTVGLDVLALRDTLTELDAGLKGLPLEDAVARFQGWGDELGLSKSQMKTLLDQMPELRAQIAATLKASGQAADTEAVYAYALQVSTAATETQQVALEALQGVAVDTETDVNALADAIRNFGSLTFDTEQAAIDFQQSLADLDGALVDGAGSLDITTEAGRNTLSAMLDVAQSTNDYAASVAAMGGSTEQVQGILEAGRQKIIDTRLALGDSQEAAKAYADQIIATPETIQTQVQLTGIAEAENLLNTLTLTRVMTIKVNSVGPVAGSYIFPDSANGNLFSYKAFANGGVDTGIYSGRAGGIQKFAEPETGWEAFISGKPSERQRNIGIWQETGQRLGLGGSDSPSMSLDGVSITGVLEIGGDGLARIIDGRIVQGNQDRTRRLEAGRRP